MSEFNNRMEVQRQVLEIVNRNYRLREELCGISRKAIDRWVHVNQIDREGDVVAILTSISSKLFFLSTKSQEQVAGSYQAISRQITTLQRDLLGACRKVRQRSRRAKSKKRTTVD